MTLALDDIKEHWQNWARSYGVGLRATTKTPTVKLLELDALRRAIRDIQKRLSRPLRILEAGCGNGHNCIVLAQDFPDCRFVGFDYIPEMVEAARQLAAESGLDDRRLRLLVDDVQAPQILDGGFDIIFTVRCLINLNTDAMQARAITALAGRLNPGGELLMLENSRQTHANQNRARELVGLPARPPAEFNHFFSDDAIRFVLTGLGLEVAEPEDFDSLHDLVLYALVPMINDGKVDYDNPLVLAAAQLNAAISSSMPGSLGRFGQNRMYRARKAEAAA